MEATDSVAKWMSLPKGVLDASRTVLEACQLMSQASIGSVLVSEGERVVGILTERDVVRRVVSAGRDPSLVRVSEVMSSPVISISADASIFEAARAMATHRIRRLPVVRGNRLVGLITADDLARYLSARSNFEDELLNALARYTKPPKAGPYA